MFSITSFLSLALAASSVVGFAIPVQHRALHRRYYATNGDILEPYDLYHARYLRLDCEDHHNTTFFDHCCHPFLKTQTESMLPADCVAPSSSTSQAAAAPTVPADNGSGNAESAPSTTTTPPVDTDAAAPTDTATSTDDATDAAAPTSSSQEEATTGSSSSNDDSGDDSEYCNEGDADCDCVWDDEDPSSTATADASSAPTDTPADSGSDDSSAPTATVTQDATSTVYSAPTDSGSDNSGSDNSGSQNAGSDPASSGSSSSGDSGDITGGFATFFYQNGVAGACGNVNPDSALIAAMDSARYASDNGPSPLCGKQVFITNVANGKSVTVTVADECPTCANANSIDLSTGAFDQIADEATGEVDIVWHFV